jgi:DNA-directed RNA polymerase subunit RPC12/RpoP
MARFRTINRRDAWRGVLMVVLFMLVMYFALEWVRPRRGIFLAVALILAVGWAIVAWYARAYGYRCGDCGKVFQIAGYRNFTSLQAVGKRPDGTYQAYKWLVCPHCGKRTKAVGRPPPPRGGGPTPPPRD